MVVKTMSVFFALLALVAAMIFLSIVGTSLWGRFTGRDQGISRLRALASDYGLMLAWAIAVVATLGSLYYSEVANFAPCKLCWYQRIAMYPQAVVLGFAAFRHDFAVRTYALPMVVIGALISTYHYVIEWFPSLETGASCDPTAPCTTRWVLEFGFVSIPFMALSGFAAIAALLFLLPRQKGRRHEEQQGFAIDVVEARAQAQTS